VTWGYYILFKAPGLNFRADTRLLIRSNLIIREAHWIHFRMSAVIYTLLLSSLFSKATTLLAGQPGIGVRFKTVLRTLFSLSQCPDGFCGPQSSLVNRYQQYFVAHTLLWSSDSSNILWPTQSSGQPIPAIFCDPHIPLVNRYQQYFVAHTVLWSTDSSNILWPTQSSGQPIPAIFCGPHSPLVIRYQQYFMAHTFLWSTDTSNIFFKYKAPRA
jgi:hypothetical protein